MDLFRRSARCHAASGRAIQGYAARDWRCGGGDPNLKRHLLNQNDHGHHHGRNGLQAATPQYDGPIVSAIDELRSFKLISPLVILSAHQARWYALHASVPVSRNYCISANKVSGLFPGYEMAAEGLISEENDVSLARAQDSGWLRQRVSRVDGVCERQS